MSQYSCPRNIVVDFDGTICDFAFPGIGSIKSGALYALTTLRSMGFRIIISSCRTCKFYPEIFAAEDGKMGADSIGHKAMVKWLDDNKVPYDEVDDGIKGKPMADYYIDDKGVHYNNDWCSVIQNIISREMSN